MLKLFYHDLKRKMKITHNSRSIRSEFKNAWYKNQYCDRC